MITTVTLIVVGCSAVYGLITSMKPKTPLFYRIVVYGFGSYFFGITYSLLYQKIVSGQASFHAGYLGYAGTFFFLFSSYFGALDRLADGREKEYRIYRVAALVPVVCIFVAGIYRYLEGGGLIKQLLLLPVAGTAYFSCKHLLLPDVEMGIIRSMRLYNAIILIWCLIQPFAIELLLGNSHNTVIGVMNTLIIAAALPLARAGVKKWFI